MLCTPRVKLIYIQQHSADSSTVNIRNSSMQGGDFHAPHGVCDVTAEPGDGHATMVTAGPGHGPYILQGVRVGVEPVDRVARFVALPLSACDVINKK